MAKRLQGKVALITGGARGIGAAAARLFSQHGGKVLIADIQTDLGRRTSDEIQSESGNSCPTSSATSRATPTSVLMHGQLDIMYSNAGIGDKNKVGILSVDREVFRKVFDTNVYGSFLAAKHAARVMVPGRSGTILLTASSATVSYGLAPHVYSTSKHTVVGLAKNLCVELGGFGIRVNCVSVATLRAIETSGMGGMRTRKSS
ncbi:unnamed protein product [Linum tenue]|uniref:Uncharacterized protein n=1 Tax=Linum tenue TaxID=586396 RepID=A0AAV0IYM3_9ROSI|nr:unnamed protein product [Linum tenue]